MSDHGAVAATKPGWKTSEFWLALAAQVIPILQGTGVIHGSDGEKYAGFAVQILALLGYTASRTLIKK